MLDFSCITQILVHKNLNCILYNVLRSLTQNSFGKNIYWFLGRSKFHFFIHLFSLLELLQQLPQQQQVRRQLVYQVLLPLITFLQEVVMILPIQELLLAVAVRQLEFTLIPFAFIVVPLPCTILLNLLIIRDLDHFSCYFHYIRIFSWPC